MRPDPPQRCRIALAHDWLVARRGGEAVLDAIARAVLSRGDQVSAIYTMFDSGVRISDVLDPLPRRVSSLNRLPSALRRWLLPAYPRAVGELSRRLATDHRSSPVDLVISTSSAAIKGLHPPDGVPHICYCHAPARYLWSQTTQYGLGAAGRLRLLGLNAFGPILRKWDRRTAASVTTFIANSRHTAAEILRCYGRQSEVIHPPVRTEFFTPPESSEAAASGEGFWLYAGALEPYKRVDLAIAAAEKAEKRLVIIGEGTQSGTLRERAGPGVTFLGRADDIALRDHYRRAELLMFPQVEDFGIVAAEAQACGTPVLAARAGGALDTVIEGLTGAFFDKPEPESIVTAAARVPRKTPETVRACREQAERFSDAAFVERVRAVVDRAVSARPTCGS